MKRITTTLMSTLIAFLLVLSFGFFGPGILSQENRLALVVGNAAYKSSPLRNPVNDAFDVARTLRTLGFEVIHEENANQRTMENAISRFGRQLRKQGGVGLFYFAGHGIQVNGRNYLIPIDAEIETESDVRFEAVDAGRVLGKMEDAGNDLNIVILDACRDNPFARSFRTSSKGLARMDAPKGSLIAYATAPGSVAADGKGRNGIYTEYLLKHMATLGSKVEEVLKRVRVDVINETNEKQIPWEASSLTGEFYFAPKRGIAVVKRPPVEPQRPERDEGLEKEREQLERERQELERLKIEIDRKKLEAERKRLEAEKKKLEMAKPKPEQKYSPKATKKYDLSDLEILVVSVARRQSHAEKISSRLKKYGAKVKMKMTSDSGNSNYIGKIFYSNNGDEKIAEMIAQSVKDIEYVKPSKEDSSYREYRLWVAK